MKNLNLFRKIPFVAAFVTAISMATAQAQTLVTANLATPDSTVINTGSGEPRTYINDGDLGFLFKVGSNDLVVNDLGVYAPQSGLPGATTVNLYALSGDSLSDEIGTSPIATATVAAKNLPNSNGYAFVPVTPTALLAGQYYLIDYVDSSVDRFYDATFSEGGGGANTGLLFDTADITPEENLINSSGTAQPGYPQQFTSQPYYISANAEFIVGKLPVTTPEPSSLALLMAGGFAALGFFRLRQKA